MSTRRSFWSAKALERILRANKQDNKGGSTASCHDEYDNDMNTRICEQYGQGCTASKPDTWVFGGVVTSPAREPAPPGSPGQASPQLQLQLPPPRPPAALAPPPPLAWL